MQYFGGKSKLASKLVAMLESYRKPGQTYLEPFVGAANVIIRMGTHGPRFGSDVHPDLILLLQAVQSGSFLYPETVSEADYRLYQTATTPSALRAFIGFGCSYAGRWFEGYARAGKRNYCLNAKNSLLKKKPGMQDVVFVNKDYRDWQPVDTLVYCDPPYTNHKKISRMRFDHSGFWNLMRQWSANNQVFISEYQAPVDFECVAEFATHTDISGTTGKLRRTERLFRFRSDRSPASAVAS